jgi:L-aspartate oxidase
VNLRGDFLIIGSGVAGLRAAIALAAAGDVVVLTKAERTESNTGYAQGGIAAALGADDTPQLHAHDTLAAGDGLCDPAAVDVLVHEGTRYVRELLDWGAAFDRDAQGHPALAREAAHSVRRVLHARDATGREIGRVLWARVAANDRIHVLDDARAATLAIHGGVCVGATFLDRDGALHGVQAGATLLATGGAGQVFRETTNPAVATGDGIAMAFRAGARVSDLEFVQFHPTALAVSGAPRFLLSEALRGEGAHLINDVGETFMQRYESAGDLASRDLVARAIVREMQRTGAPVYLTAAHLDHAYVRRRFPTIAEACRQAGLDLAIDRIPVSPAAHYVMGGVETDLQGRTSVPGLFAAGEVACTGVHGANRLASNSLLEGLVFGARAAEAMVRGLEHRASDTMPPVTIPTARPSLPAPAMFEVEQVRDLMWQQVGLLRGRQGLAAAATQLEQWWRAFEERSDGLLGDLSQIRVASMTTVAYLVTRAALRREESRGSHFRADFPRRDDIHWKRHTADQLVPDSRLRTTDSGLQTAGLASRLPASGTV